MCSMCLSARGYVRVSIALMKAKGVRRPGAGIADSCEPPDYQCWELNSGSSGRAASALNPEAMSPARP